MFPEVPEVLQGQEVQRRLYAHEWLYMPDDQENQYFGDDWDEDKAITPYYELPENLQIPEVPENLQIPEVPENLQAQEPVGQYDAPQYPES